MLAAALGLAACDPGVPAEPVPDATPYLTLYFFDGNRLLAEARPLRAAGTAVELMVEMLASGPLRADLESALPPDTRVVEQTEAGGGLIVELEAGFWSGSADAIREGAAQIVYTLAALEEGRQVTLLDGLVPGDVRDSSGDPLAQPLSRDDFPEFLPRIEVVHPVAGELVADPIPVRAVGEGPLVAELLVEGDLIARAEVDGGLLRLDWSGVEKTAVVRVRAGKHYVDIPVRLAR